MAKILFIIFLLIAFVPTVRKFLMWLVMGNRINNTQDTPRKKAQRKAGKEGEINVDFVPKNPKEKGFDGGQYVDYEEVD